MAILEVITYPHRLLKQQSSSVDCIDNATKILIQDLIDTLNHFSGCVGIAAPQTGNLRRIVVIDASRNRKPVDNHGLQILINPVIVEQSGEEIAREGCLSIPDFTANVKRAKRIQCQSMNIEGKEVLLESTGFEARVILHETDHLDGLLFLDRVSSLKTDVFRRKHNDKIDKTQALS